MTIESLFQHPQVLPPLPLVVQQLLASLSSDDQHNDQLVQWIASDSALSAELLRHANSAYFERANPIATIDQALQHLGWVNVRSLVIRSGLMARFTTVPVALLKPFWQHSLYTAVAARYWAADVGLCPDLAYMLGLLHAVGQLVMRVNLPQQMQAIDQQLSPRHWQRRALEQQVLGYCYRQVGAELARRWQFPPLFVAVLSDADSAQFPPAASMRALIEVAAWQAWSSMESPQVAELTASWPDRAARLIGLQAEQVGEKFPSWQTLCGKLEQLLD